MTVVHWPAERWLRWPHLGDRHGRALLALAFYVAAASGLAAAGDTRSTVLLLAAVVVTLPLGVVAFVGVYAVYGVLVEVARGLGAQVMNGNGWGPTWFVVLDEAALAVLFAAVALANVLTLRLVWANRGTGRRKPPCS